MTEHDNPKIALIGGGSGSSTLLAELKYMTPEITAIVNMSDDGGSSGRLREEYGVLPPGDVRQCLTALSNNSEARDVFKHRYSEGDLAGHTVGNLFLAYNELAFDFDFAVKAASTLLDITGTVVPITTDRHDLVMEDGNDTTRGEFAIAYHMIRDHEAPLYLDPPSFVHPMAEAALYEADLVAIAPGNLYGSLLPALAVSGVATALQKTSARKVVVANLLNNPMQTSGWHVVDYVKRLERMAGEGVIDDVLYNNHLPDATLLGAAAKPGERPVHTSSERFHEVAARPHGDALLASETFVPDVGDTLVPRSQIRHDAKRVGEHLVRLANERTRR